MEHFPVLGKVGEIIVMPAGDHHKLYFSGKAPGKLLCLGKGYDLILIAVEEEDRKGDPSCEHPVVHREEAGEEGREKRIVHSSQGLQGKERGFENHPSCPELFREHQGRVASQRAPVKNELLSPKPLPFQVQVGSLTIKGKPLLRRLPLALPIPPVIEDEKGGLKKGELLCHILPIPEATGIAVEVEDRELPFSRIEQGVDLYPVAGTKEELFPVPPGEGFKRVIPGESLREKDEAPF